MKAGVREGALPYRNKHRTPQEPMANRDTAGLAHRNYET